MLLFSAGMRYDPVHFSWVLLLAIGALVLLGSVGTGFIRGQLACKYCRQRELGCPAEQLFNKTKRVEQV